MVGFSVLLVEYLEVPVQLLELVPSRVDHEVAGLLDVQALLHVMEVVETVVPELVVLADHAVAAGPD
eukprot:8225060-Pyramimonas_sp.AAC.1